jgi:hypothetical protein
MVPFVVVTVVAQMPLIAESRAANFMALQCCFILGGVGVSQTEVKINE